MPWQVAGRSIPTRVAHQEFTEVVRQNSLEIWQNHVNTYSECDVNVGRIADIAYIEFGAPDRLQILNGILDKNGIVVGQTLQNPIRRLIMALGGRCYQYGGVNQKTALPDNRTWYVNDLAPFFRMVSQVQPHLENARTVSHIACVYSEATRYRYQGFNRDQYIRLCNELTNAYMARSLPLRWINCLDLPSEDLTCFRLLVVPTSSGLTASQLKAMQDYAQNGGTVLIIGDALRYDEKGFVRDDFALALSMGLHFRRVLQTDRTTLSNPWGKPLPPGIHIKNLVVIEPDAGQTLLSVALEEPNQQTMPLLHKGDLGQGQVLYLASADSMELITTVIDEFSGQPLISVTPPDKQVILTRQVEPNHWVLHLIGDGEYTVTVNGRYVEMGEVVDKFPKKDWDYKVEKDNANTRVHIWGAAADRLLVFQVKE